MINSYPRTTAVAAIPAGVILPYGGASAPSGWLLCDGAAVSRTAYAALFAAIGTAYGPGDGSTTFNIPDLRGRYALGKDDMGGSAANRVTATQADNLGQGSGAENHTLTIAEMPAHTHPPSSGNFMNIETGSTQRGEGVADVTNAAATGSTGGGGAHNNMPPYQTTNYLVKT